MDQSYSDDEDQGDPNEKAAPTEQEIDAIVAQALASAAKGENVDHLLEVMCNLFPSYARKELINKFKAGLAKKKLAEPSADPGILPRSKLVRLYQTFMRIIEQQAVKRVQGLMRRSNQVASEVVAQGEVLAGKGTTFDNQRLTGANANTVVPSASPNTGRESEERGR